MGEGRGAGDCWRVERRLNGGGKGMKEMGGVGSCRWR